MTAVTRTHITETEDGSFKTTLYLRLEHIQSFLRWVESTGYTPNPVATLLPDLPPTCEDDKPPPQRASVEGFAAFGPMGGAPIEALVKEPPFQAFVEQRYPINDGVDSLTHARRIVRQHGPEVLNAWRSMGV